MKVLIKGPIHPGRGDSYRVFSLVFPLSKYCELILLEEKRTKISYDERYKIFKRVYFYNPFHISSLSLGSFFADLNPSYWLSMLRIIEKERPDIIQITHPIGIPSAKLIARLIDKRIKVVYDAHNIEAEMGDIYAHPKFSTIKRWVISKYFPLIEKISVTFTDHIISVSKLDRDQFIERYGISGEKISVIPIGTVLPEISKVKQKFREESKITILFHGTYYHPPNKEAVDIILRKIAPKIKQGNVVFFIAGIAMPKFREQNVISLGYIENLDEVVSSCDIAIVPILRGGGTRVKILDYMRAGLPIVATKKGIEGIEAKNGEHAIIVDDVNEEFIDAIKYLIDNEQERKRIGANARRLAEEEYDWDKIGEKLDGLYRKILMEAHK